MHNEDTSEVSNGIGGGRAVGLSESLRSPRSPPGTAFVYGVELSVLLGMGVSKAPAAATATAIAIVIVILNS